MLELKTREDIDGNRYLKEYKDTFRRLIPLTIPSLMDDEIERAVDYSIFKRFQDSEMTLHNNYKHIKVQSSLAAFTNYILDKKPIMTPYGVLFSRHGTVPNPLYDMVDDFVAIRGRFKDKMFECFDAMLYEEANRYNLLQLVAKVDVNAIYGAIGAMSSIFYNIYCAGGVTSAGRGAISASIMLFESFLANNIKFGSLNEVMTFIDNIRTERPNRHFQDENVLDKNIDLENCFGKIILSCGYEWVPSKRECEIIWDTMSRLDQEDLNRIYYKNNLYAFCNNSKIQSVIIDILVRLKAPFLNPNKPPEEIKEEIGHLYELFKEYVYYPYIIIDKLDRIETMIRQIVLITDTDSCIISLETWYRYVLNLTKGMDMKIMHQLLEVVKRVEVDEFGDITEEMGPVVVEEEPQLTYDFYNDKIIEQKRLISDVYVQPADGFRHSIINIMSYVVSQLILDYMVLYTKHYNSWDASRKCMLIMKNEFLFKSVMLTNGMKNYASIKEVQEGHIVPPDKGLSISGLVLDKVGTPASTSTRLKRIIHDLVLDCDEIDQKAILSELAILQKQIYDSLIDGEIKYYKPARIKPASAYSDPMRQQGIKASVAYNALKEPKEEAINLDQGNSILIIKTNLDKKSLARIQVENPEFYEKGMKLIADSHFKGGVDAIGIPMDQPVPKWIIPFIDYASIVHDNINSFPLESVGFNRLDNKSVNYSNILEL